jgi:hypothetical protein
MGNKELFGFSYSAESSTASKKCYEIHLLRLEKLHHLPSDTTIAEIDEKLKDIHILMNSEQISKTLKHIFFSLFAYSLTEKGLTVNKSLTV